MNFSPFFDLTSFFGQDILFAKKLGSAFWAWVATELHAANETIKGWTRGLCPVVVESCIAIYVSHKFQLCPIARTLPKPQLNYLRTSSSPSLQVGIYQGFLRAFVLVGSGMHNNIVLWHQSYSQGTCNDCENFQALMFNQGLLRGPS